MKAVRFHQHGGPEVLQVAEVPRPSPGCGEVLVRVKACAVNHLDLWNRRGMPGRKVPLPRIPGADVAGIVEEIGQGVLSGGEEGRSGIPALEPGMAVILNPGLSCGRCPACLSGQDNLCPQYTVLGSVVDGGYAEYVRVPAQNVVPMPSGLSFEEAAAVPLVFLTAWHMLVGLAQVRPGERVLVWGAGSGVGMAAIQIAKLFGAYVIATAGTPEKLEKARELGADAVIDHSAAARGEVPPVSEQVRAITGRRGVEVVVEHVGEATWEQSIRSLAHGGRLVTCGATTGYEATTDIRYLFARQLRLFGSYMGSKGELLTLLPFVEQGKLKPVVDRVFPLEQAAEAHRWMEERRHFGKVVLRV